MTYRPPDCAIALGKLVAQLPTIVADLARQHSKITQKIDALIKEGISDARPLWKRGGTLGHSQYLLLRSRQQAGSRRISTYIGADKEAQKEALDKIKRHDQVQDLTGERNMITYRIRELAWRLHQCYTTLGYQPPTSLPSR